MCVISRKNENVGVQEYVDSWPKLEYIHLSYDPFDRPVWYWAAFRDVKWFLDARLITYEAA
jgi:hypothetical protein